jgi:hypothetical protein
MGVSVLVQEENVLARTADACFGMRRTLDPERTVRNKFSPLRYGLLASICRGWRLGVGHLYLEFWYFSIVQVLTLNSHLNEQRTVCLVSQAGVPRKSDYNPMYSLEVGISRPPRMSMSTTRAAI